MFSADPKLINGSPTPGSTGWRSPTTTSAMPAGRASSRRSQHQETGGSRIGAGKSLAAARKPAMLEAGGINVAFLGYDTIAGSYGASATGSGSAQMTPSIMRADIKASPKAGADVVIIFPHWGTEYHSKPFAGQQALPRMIIDSGADIVIGNHAHWAAAMEVYKGKPIWYALGNFVFDQTCSKPTMEGITLELTFAGAASSRPGCGRTSSWTAPSRTSSILPATGGS